MGKHPELYIGPAVTLELRARIEGSERMATPAIGLDAADFAWQLPRVGLKGAVTKRLHFEVEREFGNPSAEWKDIYADLRITKAFNVSVGRFKLPFGRDALTSRVELDFVNRSLVSANLSPSRDTGVMGHGRLFGHTVEYAAGYFARDGDFARTASTAGARDTIAARLLVAPLARSSAGALSGWQVGIAATASHVDDQLGLRAQTAFADTEFFNHVFVNGRRQRLGVESAWADGPFSLTAEYITVSDQRTHMGFGSEDLPPVRASGWYAAGTWLLTGERKKGRIEPARPVPGGGYGAVEVAARIEALGFAPVSYPGTAFDFPNAAGLFGSTDRAATFGVNWYLSRQLRFQVNAVVESVSDPSRSPAPGARGRFTSSVVQLQVDL